MVMNLTHRTRARISRGDRGNGNERRSQRASPSPKFRSYHTGPSNLTVPANIEADTSALRMWIERQEDPLRAAMQDDRNLDVCETSRNINVSDSCEQAYGG